MTLLAGGPTCTKFCFSRTRAATAVAKKVDVGGSYRAWKLKKNAQSGVVQTATGRENVSNIK